MEIKNLVVPTKEHKYAIGIDFGHGETSVAYCEIGWEYRSLNLQKEKQMI